MIQELDLRMDSLNGGERTLSKKMAVKYKERDEEVKRITGEALKVRKGAGAQAEIIHFN